MQVSGTLLHCASTRELYEVFDISDPDNISRLAQLDLSDEGSAVSNEDIAVYGTRAYLSSGSKAGVLVVDFSTPSAPFVSGRWYDDTVSMSNFNRIAVNAAGTRLYVADNFRGLKVFDIEIDPDNPALITVLSSSDLGGACNEAKAQGDRVYIDVKQSGFCTFKVFDLGDSANPNLLGSVEHGCFTDGKYLSLQGAHAQLGGSNSLMTRFDISDDSAPQIVAQYTDAGGYLMGFADPTAQALYALADQGQRFAVYDLRDPFGLPVSSLAAAHTPNDIFAQGGALYLADSTGLSQYKEDFATGIYLLQGQLTRSSMNKILARQGLVFARRSNSLESYDFRAPAQAALLDSLNTPGYVYDLRLSDDAQTVYVADYSAGLSIVDVSDAGNMSLVSTASTSANVEKVCVENDQLYGLRGSYSGVSLFAYDISDPAAPGSLLDDADSISFYNDAVAISDAMIYAVTWQAQGFDFVDVSDPAAPVKSRYNQGIRSVDLQNFGRQLYVATKYNGLLVYDVGDSGNIFWQAQYDNVGLNQALSLDWPRAYLATKTTVDAIDVDSLQLDARNVTLPLSGSFDYPVRWHTPASGAAVELQCEVTAGSCEIVDVDHAAHTATVHWTTPATAGDEQIVVRAGNQHFFTSVSDRVSIGG